MPLSEAGAWLLSDFKANIRPLPNAFIVSPDGRGSYFVFNIDWEQKRIELAEDFNTLKDAEDFASTFGRWVRLIAEPKSKEDDQCQR